MDKNEMSVWIRCPICQGKTRTKVYADTVLVRFPLFCPKCKEETLIDVVHPIKVKDEVSLFDYLFACSLLIAPY